MILWWSCVVAQAGSHGVDLAWSSTVRARHDQLMSPLVHSGVSVTGGALAYRWRGQRHALATGLELDHVPARSGPAYEHKLDDGTSGKTFPSSWFTARIPTGWGVDLARSDALDLVVGGLFDARIEVLSWSYGVTWTTGYSGAFLLGPWLDARWRPRQRWTLEAGATAPLLGWMARSPYALNDDEYIRANRTHSPFVAFGALMADGRPSWLAGHQALRARAAAAYALTDVTGLLMGYRLEVWHDADPLPVLAVGHALDLGLRVSW